MLLAVCVFVILVRNSIARRRKWRTREVRTVILLASSERQKREQQKKTNIFLGEKSPFLDVKEHLGQYFL